MRLHYLLIYIVSFICIFNSLHCENFSTSKAEADTVLPGITDKKDLTKDFAPDGTIVTDITQKSIDIDLYFSGASSLIYGAVKRKRILPINDPEMQVIVVFRDGNVPFTIRSRKMKYVVFPVEVKTLEGKMPGVYHISSSDKLENILNGSQALKHKIGVKTHINYYSDNTSVPFLEKNSPEKIALIEKAIDIKREEGLYKENFSGVNMVDDTLFFSEITVPESIVEGLYLVEFFLASNREIIDSKRTFIRVQKVGVERLFYLLSKDYPYIHALILVMFSLFSGWAAYRLFRKF